MIKEIREFLEQCTLKTLIDTHPTITFLTDTDDESIRLVAYGWGIILNKDGTWRWGLYDTTEVDNL